VAVDTAVIMSVCAGLSSTCYYNLPSSYCADVAVRHEGHSQRTLTVIVILSPGHKNDRIATPAHPGSLYIQVLKRFFHVNSSL